MPINGLNTISGKSITKIGLGTMPISDFYPPFPSEAQSIQLLQNAIDLGINLIDTAMVYGDGNAERMIGKAIGNKREDLFIVTKCGLYRQGNNYLLDGQPESLIDHCKASLRRLNTDYLDALLIHRLDTNTPLADSLNALAELRSLGLVRYIGLSEVDGPLIGRALETTHIDFVQNEYSLMSREPESDGTFEYCQNYGIQFMAYSPIGRGFFTKQAKSHRFAQLDANDIRTILPRYQDDNIEKNQPFLIQLETIATQNACTLPQLALAWILAQAEQFGINIYPIPGTKRLEHIQENIKATELTLDANDIVAINTIVGKNVFHGERWPTSIVEE